MVDIRPKYLVRISKTICEKSAMVFFLSSVSRAPVENGEGAHTVYCDLGLTWEASNILEKCYSNLSTDVLMHAM